ISVTQSATKAAGCSRRSWARRASSAVLSACHSTSERRPTACARSSASLVGGWSGRSSNLSPAAVVAIVGVEIERQAVGVQVDSRGIERRARGRIEPGGTAYVLHLIDRALGAAAVGTGHQGRGLGTLIEGRISIIWACTPLFIRNMCNIVVF